MESLGSVIRPVFAAHPVLRAARRMLAAIILALIGAHSALAATVLARASAESFSVGEPIIIEMTFGGITGLRNYSVAAEPAGSNPPMGLFNSSEAGFGFPVARTDPGLPFRHDVLVNKWLTLDTPGTYTVVIDGVIAIPGSATGRRFVAPVVIRVVERDEQRLHAACQQWSDQANTRESEMSPEEAMTVRIGVSGHAPLPQRFAQHVLMYLQEEILIPCLLAGASRDNLAPAITFREIDSVAAVHALHELILSPVLQLSREASFRLRQMLERTKRPEVRAAIEVISGMAVSH